jgi:KDO2-lipid IV(A) lauroyltransferase
MLLALSLELGFPLDAAYKPLVDPWAEREMLKLRTRFGSRLVPAQQLLGDIIKRGRTPRAIAMVADQEPRTSEHKHWTRVLNRDTAFYVGAEEIARVTKFPVFFVAMRRIRRGHYEVSIEPLAEGGESLAPGELTERYARRVEAQIRAAPPDWPWSHKRWKLKRSLYGKE